MGPMGALPAPGPPSLAHRLPQTPAPCPCTSTQVPNLDSASHIPRFPAKATSAFVWQPSSLQPCGGTDPATLGSLQAREGEREEDTRGNSLALHPTHTWLWWGPSPPAPHAKGVAQRGHATSVQPVSQKSHPRHPPLPREPSLNLQGKSPVPANAPQVLFPRMLWNRDPPGSH